MRLKGFLIALALLGIMRGVEAKKIERILGPNSDEIERQKVARAYKDFDIEITGNERAVVKTNKGTFVIKFYPDAAPITVKNFIRLSLLGFYDGLTFHRYVENFVIQGGDPLGNGTGDAGYTIPLEVSEKRKHKEGAVGMARAQDPNSGSCQFYITLSPQPHLDGKYTVFGEVVEGMDVVKSLRAGDRIERIDIISEEK
jgi:cyclophilin family peptidyl-prolyl cis-trans isomerase